MVQQRGQQGEGREERIGDGEREKPHSERHDLGEPGEDEMAALRARLDKLSSALDAQQQLADQEAGAGNARSSPAAMGSVISLAFRVMSEFISAIVVGGLIGWGIDHLAGSSPLFLIIFVLFGAAAGFWNVYRLGTAKPGSESE